jgi:hypothetical protein
LLRNINAFVKDVLLPARAGCGHSTPFDRRRIRSEAMAVRTTKITIETEGLLVARQARTVVAWCAGCQAEVEVMLLDQNDPAAQLLAGQPIGKLHLWTSPEGPAQICLPSLLQRSNSNDPQPVQIAGRTLANKGEGQ